MSAIRPLSPWPGLIGQRRADDGRDDLMHIGEPLDRIGEGLLVDLGVFRPDAVADRPVGDGGEFEVHGGTLLWQLPH